MKSKSFALSIIFNSLKKQIIQVSIVVICSLIYIGFSSSLPLVYKFLIDNIVSNNKPQEIPLYVLLFVFLAIIILLLNYIKEKIMYNTTDSISRELREFAFKRCLNMQYCEFEKIGYQKMLKSITREIGRICDVFINDDLPRLISQSIQLIFIFSMLVLLNWQIAILFFLISPILFFVMKKSRRKIEILDDKLMKLLIRCDNYLTHSLLGIKTIKTFNGEEREVCEFKKWLDDNTKLGWKVKSLHNFIKFIIPTIFEQTILGVILVISTYFVTKKQISVGDLVAIVSYIPLLFNSLNDLLGVQIKLSEIKNPIKCLDEIFNSQQENGKTLVNMDSDYIIDIENLLFTYGREFSNIHISNLKIKNGEFIAIVGKSGAGKSVIFDIICKFYKIKSGKFKFCGHDLDEVNTKQLRDIVKLVSQNTFLWNKSIKENIIYPDKISENFDKERYKKCIELAQLSSIIESLPDKDNTILGDFGSQISGGEAQRISLARVFYSNYNLLLLDEPTSALDGVASKEIINSIIKENKKGKTIIMITHNIQQALLADKIAFIMDSELVDFDSPQRLLENNLYFRDIYQKYYNEDIK